MRQYDRFTLVLRLSMVSEDSISQVIICQLLGLLIDEKAV